MNSMLCVSPYCTQSLVELLQTKQKNAAVRRISFSQLVNHQHEGCKPSVGALIVFEQVI